MTKDISGLLEILSRRATTQRKTALSNPKIPPPVPEAKSGSRFSDADAAAIHDWILKHYGVTEAQIKGWIQVGLNPPGGT
ncbi:MAG: hypothetical protein LBO00_07605 [Zoogloeaceae bacterium]|jgi:hypothetical protein|nr:hypothetical protein [Zoogloeaceae bacterium]